MSARATTFLTELRAAVSGEVREAEPLSRYSTYRIGGPATMLFPKAVEDIERAASLATGRGVAWFALGLGSNVLLPDEGLDALVIRLGKGLDAIKSDGDRWTIGAGLPAPIAARRTAESGWSGLHKMVGVPGSVGGGVFMNAGCHGAEWADVIEAVTVVDWDGTVRERSRDEIPFSYRRSGLSRAASPWSRAGRAGSGAPSWRPCSTTARRLRSRGVTPRRSRRPPGRSRAGRGSPSASWPRWVGSRTSSAS